MTKPTHQDATLMIQLAQWGSIMDPAGEAGSWIFSDEFIPDYTAFLEKHPRGSEGHAKVGKVLGWWETIGTLYKHGLFSGELLFDWLAVDVVWERLEGFALGAREQAGRPTLWENFEFMAKAKAKAIANDQRFPQ